MRCSNKVHMAMIVHKLLNMYIHVLLFFSAACTFSRPGILNKMFVVRLSEA